MWGLEEEAYIHEDVIGELADGGHRGEVELHELHEPEQHQPLVLIIVPNQHQPDRLISLQERNTKQCFSKYCIHFDNRV